MTAGKITPRESIEIPRESSSTGVSGATPKRFWKWAEKGLLLLGVALLFCFAGAHMDRYLNSRAALESFDSPNTTSGSSKDAVVVESSLEPFTVEEPDFKDWNESRARAYKQADSNHTSAAIAVLAIPAIDLVAPVMEGTDASTLNHAVGRIQGTAHFGEEGNIGLAAHRDSFFRGLKDVKPGDTIELRARDGRNIYTIDHTQIVTPSDVSVLRSHAAPSLTLVTCYPFYFIGSAPKRFVVTAYLTQHTPAGKATSEARAN